MHRILPESEDNIIGIRVSGTLHKEDYEALVPFLKQRIDTFGEISILFEMEDFHGWDPQGLWEDLKFDLRYNRAMACAAMVGDRRWEEWMTKLMAPFAHAETRYFDLAQREEAWAWIRACAADTAPTNTRS